MHLKKPDCTLYSIDYYYIVHYRFYFIFLRSSYDHAVLYMLQFIAKTRFSNKIIKCAWVSRHHAHSSLFFLISFYYYFAAKKKSSLCMSKVWSYRAFSQLKSKFSQICHYFTAFCFFLRSIIYTHNDYDDDDVFLHLIILIHILALWWCNFNSLFIWHELLIIQWRWRQRQRRLNNIVLCVLLIKSLFFSIQT